MLFVFPFLVPLNGSSHALREFLLSGSSGFISVVVPILWKAFLLGLVPWFLSVVLLYALSGFSSHCLPSQLSLVEWTHISGDASLGLNHGKLKHGFLVLQLGMKTTS